MSFGISGAPIAAAPISAPLVVGVYTAVAETGAYTVSGPTTTLRAIRYMTGDGSSYTLTGVDPSLLLVRRITAPSNPYTLAGQAAAFSATRYLGLAHATFAVTGVSTPLIAIRKLTASNSAYTFTYNSARVYLFSYDTSDVEMLYPKYELRSFDAYFNGDEFTVAAERRTMYIPSRQRTPEDITSPTIGPEPRQRPRR